MSNWTDIIKTVKKVNQEIIVMDGEETFVVMPFKRYDSLLEVRLNIQAMSEEEFLNEINRQVAIWRASQEERRESQYPAPETGKKDEADEINDTFYIEPVE